MLEYDPKTSIQHWPTPMAKYGQNLYGDNLYRIVLASSVRHLVGGQWDDGSRCYHWRPRYPNVRAAWILERWSQPTISRREWESYEDPLSGWPLLGPYPSRGEYELAFEFDHGVDADSLDNIVAAVERKRYRSFQDDRDQIANEREAEQKAFRSARDAEIRDAFTAFGVTPKPISSLTGVFRGTKTMPELLTAEECGLPVPNAPARRKPITARKTFDVRDAQVTSTLLAGA